MTTTMRLTKKQAMTVAKDAALEGRVTDALLVLTEVMPRESALRELAPLPSATVGDILVSSWGYEQTNIDFYQVVRVSASSVWIRRIYSKAVSAGTGYDMVVAVPNEYVSDEEPSRHRINKGWYGDRYCVSLSRRGRHSRPSGNR